MSRWHIVATRKHQSLAEHTYNVCQIALALLDKVNMREHWGGKVLLIALDHDVDEVVTGDIPTPGKSPYDWSGPVTPADVVKMADIIDAYTFITSNAIDRHGEHVARYVGGLYGDMVKANPTWEQRFEEVVEDILHGEYT